MSCENCLNNTLLIQELSAKVDRLINVLSNTTNSPEPSILQLLPKTNKVSKKASRAAILSGHAQYLKEFPLIHHFYTENLKKQNLWVG